VKLLQRFIVSICLFFVSLLAVYSSRAYAGVFNLPRFVAPGAFGIGAEPEFILSDGGGVGINLRYVQGVSDTNNFTGILGSGNGPRYFRAGGFFTFDIFPDLASQPGVGLATGAQFVQLSRAGSVEILAIPYIHKNFSTQEGPAEPFLAVPLGLTLSEGAYKYLSTLSIGSFFHMSEHFSSIAELGIGLNNSVSYISGGIIYYH
jgi:hypothetical protein